MNRYLGKIGRVQVNLLIEPRDLWVGVFRGRRYWEMGQLHMRLYVFLVPVVGFLLTIDIHGAREGDED